MERAFRPGLSSGFGSTAAVASALGDASCNVGAIGQDPNFDLISFAKSRLCNGYEVDQDFEVDFCFREFDRFIQPTYFKILVGSIYSRPGF